MLAFDFREVMTGQAGDLLSLTREEGLLLSHINSVTDTDSVNPGNPGRAGGALSASEPPTPCLLEGPWVFSHRAQRDMQLALGLGVVNLLGVLWLRSVLDPSSSAAFHAPEGPLTPLIRYISGFLRLYALAFLLVPALRWLLFQGLNRGLAHRNALRREYAAKSSASSVTTSLA